MTFRPAPSPPASPGQGRDIAAQLRAVESVTDVALGHLGVNDLLNSLLDRIADLMDVDTVAALLLDQKSQQLVAQAARGVEEEVRQGFRLAVGHGFAGQIAATRQPMTLNRVDSTTVANPLLWEKGIRTMLGVPLISGDELVGVLHVGSFSERRFTDDDADLLAHVAARIAAAVQTRQLSIERSAALVLQRSFLPASFPQLPGIAFASRYVPAQVGGVGGDWYDAFALSNGDLWVVVGDVAGHDTHAATVMARLRSIVRAYALDGLDPEEVLAKADREVRQFEPDDMATVLCGVLHPPYDQIRLSLAGHLPPIVASPNAQAVLLDIKPDLPLGVMTDIPRRSVTMPLAPGCVFVAYTDGLIERRARSLDFGFDLLCQSVQPQAPELVCSRAMDDLVGREVPLDDIALLVLRRSLESGT